MWLKVEYRGAGFDSQIHDVRYTHDSTVRYVAWPPYSSAMTRAVDLGRHITNKRKKKSLLCQVYESPIILAIRMTNFALEFEINVENGQLCRMKNLMTWWHKLMTFD